ncbi:hypothetical protein [Nocardia sp. SYP-A9097]|uniref:hypothetical protein n=1 Tax=Nocardia sp. SYP-A9097 TaxID=2663237 RepID=UPI001E34DC18|nr:hypothetical protein [Nocardia sp. SYP-A9097]
MTKAIALPCNDSDAGRRAYPASSAQTTPAAMPGAEGVGGHQLAGRGFSDMKIGAHSGQYADRQRLGEDRNEGRRGQGRQRRNR